jgi:hypothetical protein
VDCKTEVQLPLFSIIITSLSFVIQQLNKYYAIHKSAAQDSRLKVSFAYPWIGPFPPNGGLPLGVTKEVYEVTSKMPFGQQDFKIPRDAIKNQTVAVGDYVCFSNPLWQKAAAAPPVVASPDTIQSAPSSSFQRKLQVATDSIVTEALNIATTAVKKALQTEQTGLYFANCCSVLIIFRCFQCHQMLTCPKSPLRLPTIL